MNDISSDDIFLLKQRLAEQEALIHALQEKLSNREREIDHLQAQLDKLRRMNFGSRSEKVSRRIAQMEADLNRLQKESDTLTGRVYDPAVQRPLRQTRTRKPFPESLPRAPERDWPHNHHHGDQRPGAFRDSKQADNEKSEQECQRDPSTMHNAVMAVYPDFKRA